MTPQKPELHSQKEGARWWGGRSGQSSSLRTKAHVLLMEARQEMQPDKCSETEVIFHQVVLNSVPRKSTQFFPEILPDI